MQTMCWLKIAPLSSFAIVLFFRCFAARLCSTSVVMPPLSVPSPPTALPFWKLSCRRFHTRYSRRASLFFPGSQPQQYEADHQIVIYFFHDFLIDHYSNIPYFESNLDLRPYP